MSKHTPEPWYRAQSVHNYEDVEQCYIYGGKNVIAVRVCLRDDDKSDPADANRDTTDHITKCVNACAGINPEAVPGIVEACNGLVSALDAIRADLGTQYPALSYHYVTARAALAKAGVE